MVARADVLPVVLADLADEGAWHRLDTGLVATGPDADSWLDIAQAFAGPPGAGCEPAERGDTT